MIMQADLLPLNFLPGNIKDIKAFKLCLEEPQIDDAAIIADKGFYSENNIKQLDEERLNFIIPLKRNNSSINCDKGKMFGKQSKEGRETKEHKDKPHPYPLPHCNDH